MNTKAECTICLGSNYNASANINKAITSLTTLFPDIIFGSPVITPAEGITPSPDYTNQAARFTTTMQTQELKKHLKEIEDLCGRTKQSKHLGIIPLDIDLLTYGENIIKPQDLNKSYVQKALSTLP